MTAMHIAKMIFQLKIAEGYSIKDRRRVLRSLRDRLKKRFNVSLVVEEDPKIINLLTLHLVQINRDMRALDSSYENCLGMILEFEETVLVHHEFDILQ